MVPGTIGPWHQIGTGTVQPWYLETCLKDLPIFAQNFKEHMSTAVKNLFDGISKRYDFLNHFLSAGRDISWRTSAVKMLGLGEKSRVLDLCGGTGDFLKAYVKMGGKLGSSVVGDFSYNMLRESTQKYRDFNCCQLDALAPPFEPQSFDVILCGFGMRNLSNLEDGIEQVHSLLKPGGHFVTLEFFRPLGGFPHFFYHRIAPLFIPLFGWVFSGRHAAYEYLVESVKKFSSEKEYQEKLEKQGFEKVKIKSCDFGIAHIVMGAKNQNEGQDG